MDIDPSKSLIGQVVPIPRDRHGRNMRIDRIGRIYVRRRREEPGYLAVSVSGTVLSKSTGAETALTESAPVPYEFVHEDDRRALAQRHRAQAERILAAAARRAAEHEATAKQWEDPELAQAWFEAEEAEHIERERQRDIERAERRAAREATR